MSDTNVFLKLHPLHRVFISIFLAAITCFFTRHSGLHILVELMLIWDVFALSYIVLCWIALINRSTTQIRDIAKREDGSRLFVFILILLASLASMSTVLMLISSKDAARTGENFYLPIGIIGMMLSWIMVHTIFTFHYAQMYYTDHPDDSNIRAGGVDFPNETHPDYLDFAYFSFVIGMTFQVSDVEVSSRKVRRFVLVHGLLAFALNTFVVALTINIIAGLKS